MSWNKDTINVSEIDSTIRVLETLNEPYKLIILGEVMGLGLNDTLGHGQEEYPIRKLEFRDKVVLERMDRTEDCDADDYLVSFMFDKNKVPKKWKLEIKEGVK